MDKVIDGVDVSGCMFYEPKAQVMTCHEESITKRCDKTNCYYKQLQRLKEENYQLQKDCQICENFIDFIPCKPIRDMDYDLQKVISQRDNYYQAIQEIMDIADIIANANCNYVIEAGNIIKKINEVIGAEE